MIRWFITLAVGMLLVLPAGAQVAPVTGLRDNTPQVHALVGATIVVAPGNVVTGGSLIIRDGVIEAVGASVAVPLDARVWDMKGQTLYAGFLDLSSDLGMPKPEAAPRTSDPFTAPARPAETPSGPAHWNPKVKAQRDGSIEFKPDEKTAEKLRSQGFALVLSAPAEGIFRGTGVLVQTGTGSGSDLVVGRNVSQHVSLEQTPGFFSGYPNSLMGAIALVRQTWYDADWYRRAQEAFAKNPGSMKRPEINAALGALADAIRGRQPVVMEASDDLGFLRGAKIGKEFGLKLWIRGSGQEYRRINAVKASAIPVIVPLNFPEAPAVESPEEALNVSLEELRHWDAAPENAARLQRAGIPFVLTSAGLKDPRQFLSQLRTAVQRGLSPDAALAALTSTPARWLGLQQRYGSLERGKAANVIVADGNLLGGKASVREVWIDGKRYEVKPLPAVDIRGAWEIRITGPQASEAGELVIKGDPEKPEGSLQLRGHELKLRSPSYSQERLAFSISGDSAGWKGIVRMSGTGTAEEIFGIGELPGGEGFQWSARRKAPPQPVPDTTGTQPVKMASFSDVFPPGEYGRPEIPAQPANLLVKGATIWTQGPEGRMENADVLAIRGKISKIGRNLAAPPDALIIDAQNKHVTPGIIDCHSHTAAASINEGGQAITAETRIEDVLDSDEIWIYRQLAGGTTMANVLHGSANPIGGQNAVVKWRWGSLPDQLLMEGAPPGIKFALGENVKQSNFLPGGRPSGRYPQTRMGVEQIIRDRFMAALDYEQTWNEWEKGKKGLPPRRDLELDALLEVVKGKRLVHAHAYRQDEILMLMRVAEEFGFRIATFQHVLEGYKVADVMAQHGAGGSSFSDWWAYKIEAWDAIPGNGPLMHAQGVLVSYNSDNSQLASRLNWEASKALEFGLSEEEALALVTINSARQLGIDKRVGSLETGKDADFVIWSGNPLSVYSTCEQTWVDGRRYFDREEDKLLRARIQEERATLLQKIAAAKKDTGGERDGGPGIRRRPNEERLQSCMEGFDHEN